MFNPKKDILDEIESFKSQQIRYFKKGKEKINLKCLLSKEIIILQNRAMNYFANILNQRDSLLLIEQTNLDIKIWQLLTERISILLKLNNFTNEIEDVIMEDLKNIFNFFKNIYLMVCDLTFSERLTSAVLFFLAEIKKIKVIVIKANSSNHNNFEELIKKDSNEALKFYQFSLNKNPNNVRTYFNIGLIYRECIKDYTTSSYWFVRSLAAPNSEMNKLKENLEKDFNIIRKVFNEKSYLIDDNVLYINSDATHMLLLFHRLMGILYMNIDLDKVEELSDDFLLIVNKVLKNYNKISEEIKTSFESHLGWEQIVLMLIFNFHYNLNQLEDYSLENEKLINKESTEKDNNKVELIYELYNHKILDSDKNCKNGYKFILPIIKNFIKSIISNYNKDNKEIIEKVLLLLMSWLSINYDISCQILNDIEIKSGLEYINFIITNEIDLSNKINYEQIIYILNNYISPVEVNFMAFKPMVRFFDLYSKKIIYKNENLFTDNSLSETLMNKIVLKHFLNLFKIGISSNANEEMFYEKENIIKTTIVYSSDIKSTDKIENSFINSQKIHTLNVKKTKALVLLDMSNIAMRHGNGNFSTKGIKICLDFFISNGHEVSGFLPEYLFRQGQFQNSNSNQSQRKISPDNREYLIELFKKGLVIQTPAHDYDDSYNIQYCKTKNAYFVTNDLYRDYIEKINDNKTKEAEKRWVSSKRISYTFNKDEFIPNPDSNFFKEYSYSSYMNTINNSKELIN